MAKKTHNERMAGRKKEYTVDRKQVTLLLPLPVIDKVKAYAKRVSKAYKVKK